MPREYRYPISKRQRRQSNDILRKAIAVGVGGALISAIPEPADASQARVVRGAKTIGLVGLATTLLPEDKPRRRRK